MTIARILPVLLAALFLAACSSASKTPPATGTTGVDQGGASSAGTGDGSLGQGTPVDSAGGALGGPTASRENRVIYFDYDRFDVKGEYNAIISAHGRYLSSNPGARARLEGHADERGSREYNIGLGEKRAQAVRQSLLLQGAAADQIATVSYGEERPAVIGSDEEAYSLNRRVEIVYGP